MDEINFILKPNCTKIKFLIKFTNLIIFYLDLFKIILFFIFYPQSLQFFISFILKLSFFVRPRKIKIKIILNSN